MSVPHIQTTHDILQYTFQTTLHKDPYSTTTTSTTWIEEDDETIDLEEHKPKNRVENNTNNNDNGMDIWFLSLPTLVSCIDATTIPSSKSQMNMSSSDTNVD